MIKHDKETGIREIIKQISFNGIFATEYVMESFQARIQVDYNPVSDNIQYFADYLMDLDETKHSFYFIYTYEPSVSSFEKDLNEQYDKMAARFRDIDNPDGVEKDTKRYFLKEELLKLYCNASIEKCYFCNSNYENVNSMEVSAFKKLFNFQNIPAIRELDDSESDSSKGISKRVIALLKEWTASDITEAADDNGTAGEREEPWKKEKPFFREDVDGKLRLVLSNGLYIDSLNLKVGIQNQIRRLAATRNPVFYKNAAIGMSNFATSQWIYLGKDHLSGYIEIPRGMYDKLTEKINEAGIPCEIKDERQCGRHIHVVFKGELREEQKPALEEMMKYDNGILQAATAFGKTVVCSAIIAEKKVNTLIILESSALLEQWKDALEHFLDIDEQLPEYKTKTGRIKVRKSLIGKLQGAHDSMTGIVDIAMVGSLCKKGEWHSLLDQYGMIIVDECHHAASDTIAEVLQKVPAKYVYGVTATPKRADGLEKVNYMLLGPIRYSYSSKEKVKA